jgi:hypothetical protein
LDPWWAPVHFDGEPDSSLQALKADFKPSPRKQCSTLAGTPLLERLELILEVVEHLFEDLEIVVKTAGLGIGMFIIGPDEIVQSHDDPGESKQGKPVVTVRERLPEHVEEEADPVFHQSILKDHRVQIIDFLGQRVDQFDAVMDLSERELPEIFDVVIGKFVIHNLTGSL